MSNIQRTQMTVQSGQHIWYHEPERLEVREQDLYAGLVNQPRYGGHTRFPWTVLQHLTLCVGIATRWDYTPLDAALCAAHDLHEAYVLDVPKGLRDCLPDYRAIEKLWEDHVHRSLGLVQTRASQDLVHRVDMRALVVEMDCLRHPLLEVALKDHDFKPVEDAERTLFRYTDLRPASRSWGIVWKAVHAWKTP